MEEKWGIPYFDGWAVERPAGEWEYCVDDHSVIYGMGQPWPFGFSQHMGRAEPVKHYPFSVRLAPDLDYRAWRNEYVLLHPSEDGLTASGIVHLWVEKQGMGGNIVDIYVTLDLAADGMPASFTGNVPQPLVGQFISKIAKLRACIRHHQARCEAGDKEPVTAYALWEKKQPAAATA